MFKVGDFVRLRNGWTKMQVIAIRPSSGTRGREPVLIIYAQYYRPGASWESSPQRREECEFVPWVDGTTQTNFKTQPTEKRSTIMLYQTKEKTPRYGTFLATDSQGKIVLEMKGTPSGVQAFTKDEIEEVVPYTFSAKVVGGDRQHACHYSYKEGLVEVGDLLMSDSGNLYRVTDLNTKNKTPKKEFKGSKVVTVRLDGGA